MKKSMKIVTKNKERKRNWKWNKFNCIYSLTQIIIVPQNKKQICV